MVDMMINSLLRRENAKRPHCLMSKRLLSRARRRCDSSTMKAEGSIMYHTCTNGDRREPLLWGVGIEYGIEHGESHSDILV